MKTQRTLITSIVVLLFTAAVASQAFAAGARTKTIVTNPPTTIGGTQQPVSEP